MSEGRRLESWRSSLLPSPANLSWCLSSTTTFSSSSPPYKVSRNILLSSLLTPHPPGLVKSSTSHETFLLCSASLSNITSITSQASTSILTSPLLTILLSHPTVTTGTPSIYILEQHGLSGQVIE